MADKPHVLVIGAGIIGASIAWYLSREGARVTVVESAEPGGVATRASWSWINANRGNPEPYFRLRMQAMAEWRTLEDAVPALDVDWSGGLMWDLPVDELEAMAVEHESWGYQVRRVERAHVEQLEPALRNPPAQALHLPGEGKVEPLAAAQELLTAAQALGAQVRAHTPVEALEVEAGRVIGVQTAIGRLDADEVVVAAGAGTVALLSGLGVDLPVTTPPGLLAHTKPCDRRLNGLVLAPEVHVRQTTEGRLVAGEDFAGTDPGDRAQAVAEELVEAIRGLLRSSDDVMLDFFTLGLRPTPGDGFPAVGRVEGRDGLYIAVTHSGITLAPAIGRFAAEEILTGQRDPLLAPYGLGRFGL